MPAVAAAARVSVHPHRGQWRPCGHARGSNHAVADASSSGKGGDQPGNRILIGDVVLGHRAGHGNTGTRPRSWEHTPTEASRPSASGPVGIEPGLSAGSPVTMARDNPDPGWLPLSWSWVRARGGIQGLCVVSSRPPSAKPSWWDCIRSPSTSSTALAASGFGSSALLFTWGLNPPDHLIDDVLPCFM